MSTLLPTSAVLAPQWVVYRLLDKAGELLYVGMTRELRGRLKAHAADKPWWGEVEKVRFEDCRNETEARQRETEAIELEAPVHNVVGQKGFHELQATRRIELKALESARGYRDGEVRAFRAGLSGVRPGQDAVRSRVVTCRHCGAMGLVFARSQNRTKRHKVYLVEAYRVEPTGMAEGNRYQFHKCPAMTVAQ